MTKDSTRILNSRDIERKVVRMAHEIHEDNYLEKEIVLIGVVKKGNQLAARLATVLESISKCEVKHYSLELHKDRPLSSMIQFSGELEELKGKVVLLVDDVMNSGRTLVYAAKYLLDAEPKKLATVALVERTHRRFPIHVDFVGLTLSTNLKEHVRVEMNKGKEAAYLE